MNRIDSRPIATDALDAFWEVVASRFPDAKTGDLSPLRDQALTVAATDAIEEWIANNVPA
jgi:hypothetical protein